METPAVLVRRNPFLGAVAAIGVSLLVLATLLVVFAPEPISRLSPLTVLLALVLLPPIVALPLISCFAWASRVRESRSAVKVTIVDSRIAIVESRESSWKPSRGRALALSPTQVRVELGTRWLWHTRLEVKSTAIARDILGALGLDRRVGTSTFKIQPRERLGPLVLLMGLMVPVALAECVSNLPLGLLILASVVATLSFLTWGRRIQLVVGTDGVDVRTLFGHDFLPHARVRSVAKVWPRNDEPNATFEGHAVSRGFAIVLDDGACHTFDTTVLRFPASIWKSDPVFDAVYDAWSGTGAASSNAAHAATLLARGVRSTREWLANLRILAATGGGSGYRATTLDEDVLFEVLADANVARDVRAAAATVLGMRETPAPRLRVAFDDVADPVLRRIATSVGQVSSSTLDDVAVMRLETELDEAAEPPRQRTMQQDDAT